MLVVNDAMYFVCKFQSFTLIVSFRPNGYV